MHAAYETLSLSKFQPLCNFFAPSKQNCIFLTNYAFSIQKQTHGYLDEPDADIDDEPDADSGCSVPDYAMVVDDDADADTDDEKSADSMEVDHARDKCDTCDKRGRQRAACKGKNCGGRVIVQVRTLCEKGCGKVAQKNGVCRNEKCGAEGMCSKGCGRQAQKNGICQDVKCGGEGRTLCNHPEGCTNKSLATGKNSKGRPGIKGRCSIHEGGPRCVAEGCPNGAVAGTGACIAHKGGIRCDKCDLYSVLRKGFLCFSCRKGTDRIKQLEMMVKDFMDKDEFMWMYTYYDSRIPCTDINRRPDFIYLVFETHVICIEVDEDAHRYYNRDCEIARVSEIMQACEGKPLFLIRFNPLVRLLGQLKSTFDAFRTAIITPETPMLTVAFIGYKREYDVAAEMERVARERAAGTMEVTEECSDDDTN